MHLTKLGTVALLVGAAVALATPMAPDWHELHGRVASNEPSPPPPKTRKPPGTTMYGLGLNDWQPPTLRHRTESGRSSDGIYSGGDFGSLLNVTTMTGSLEVPSTELTMDGAWRLERLAVEVWSRNSCSFLS
jgi:hypothetical protein